MSSSETKKSGFWGNVREIVILLLIVFLIRTFFFGLYQVPTGSMETTMLVGERFFADKFTPLFMSIKRGEVIAFNDPLWPYSNNKLVRIFQEYVWGPSNWTKRVIGIPGDHVHGTIEDGKPVIYLNGKKLSEPYINKYPLVRVWKMDPEDVEAYVRRGGQDRIWDLISPKSFDPHVSVENQPFYTMKKERILADGSEAAMIYPGTPLYPAEDAPKPVPGQNYWSGSDEFDVTLDKNQYWVMGDNRLGSKDCRWFGPINRRLIHGRIIFRVWSLDSDESWFILDIIKHPVDFWSRVRWHRFFQRVR
jgi:signal peptidase I